MSGPPDAARTMAESISPVLAGLLEPRELERVELRERTDDATGSRRLVLDIVVCGEPFTFFLWHEGQRPESGEEIRHRFFGELRNFVAESSFGWGQRRG